MFSLPTTGNVARLAAVLTLLAGAGPACRSAPTPSAEPWFVDATGQAGLAFTHHNGRTGSFYYPEVIAPGVAFFDADNDGDLDVFLVQSRDFGPSDGPGGAPESRFYRNDLRVAADGSRTVRFTDATAASHLGLSFYGM